MFKNGREAVFQALDIIEKSKIEEEILSDGTSVQQLQEEQAKLKNRLKKFQEMVADELMSVNDLKGHKVSEEMLDMFVERVIYRGTVNGNDEFLWVMNLSGDITDASAKYRIRRYDKIYADSLKDDRNFNIVARMLIPLEECKRYCEEEAHRMYKKNNWRPITLKIAIL